MTCPLAPTPTQPVDARDRCPSYSAKREARGECSCLQRVIHPETACNLDASQVAEKIKQARRAA